MDLRRQKMNNGTSEVELYLWEQAAVKAACAKDGEVSLASAPVHLTLHCPRGKRIEKTQTLPLRVRCRPSDDECYEPQVTLTPKQAGPLQFAEPVRREWAGAPPAASSGLLQTASGQLTGCAGSTVSARAKSARRVGMQGRSSSGSRTGSSASSEA